MGILYKFWAFPREKKPGGIKKICQKGGCLRWDMSHFSSENFDFRVLSEWKRLQFHDQEASTRGIHGVAYELLSRNPKSGYFVYNFDKKSVKFGFKKSAKNPTIFPISGHSCRNLRSPPYTHILVSGKHTALYIQKFEEDHISKPRDVRSQGVTDRYFVSSYWTFCPVIWLFGDVELWGFCWTCLRKVVVLVCWDCNSSVVERCSVRTSSTQGNCRIYPLDCAKKGDEKSNFVWNFQKFSSPNLQYFSKKRQIRHRIWLPKVQFFFKTGQK